jgi:hypothetical protein
MHFTEPECSLLCLQDWSPVSSQMNSIQTLPSYFFQIHFNIILRQRLRFSGDLFLSDFPTKTLCAFLLCPMRCTWPKQCHPSQFDRSNNIWRGVRSIMQSLAAVKLHMILISSQDGGKFAPSRFVMEPLCMAPNRLSKTTSALNRTPVAEPVAKDLAP